MFWVSNYVPYRVLEMTKLVLEHKTRMYNTWCSLDILAPTLEKVCVLHFYPEKTKYGYFILRLDSTKFSIARPILFYGGLTECKNL